MDRKLTFMLLLAALPVVAKEPTGPELAPREIGVLLKAYPMATASNQVTAATWVTLWGCDYQVGRAVVTVTMATDRGDPTPCKRKIAFQ